MHNLVDCLENCKLKISNKNSFSENNNDSCTSKDLSVAWDSSGLCNGFKNLEKC